jgi:hypothetical protein
VVHDFLNLLAVSFAERSTEHREVLGVDADLAPVNGAKASDDSVGIRPTVLKAHPRRDVAVKHVKFLKGVFVKEVLNSVSRRHSALRLVTPNGLEPSRNASFGFASGEFFESVCH